MSQTAIALSLVALAILAIAWKAYKSLKNSACCGSCGCSVMSPKEKKKMLAKRSAAKAKRS
ncbi:FeoB-associated Cys-rich membrane protein [Rubritalea spongiae]|uniref:FeoB-associated Cys-rich membrane protein n=1 Tax=Rubritalea spongiae TaxID=430797 RepID=A0ABW5E3Q7_9BACT